MLRPPVRVIAPESMRKVLPGAQILPSKKHGILAIFCESPGSSYGKRMQIQRVACISVRSGAARSSRVSQGLAQEHAGNTENFHLKFSVFSSRLVPSGVLPVEL